jgi:hypothetical protein
MKKYIIYAVSLITACGSPPPDTDEEEISGPGQSFQIESVDKAVSAAGLDWPNLNNAYVHIPTSYGILRNHGGRCTADYTLWPNDCKVDTDRVESVCIDNTVCEQISPNLSYGVADAVSAWFSTMTTVAGWNVTWGSCSAFTTIKVACSTSTTGNWGDTFADISGPCWDITGANDICWLQNVQNVTIKLNKVKNTYGTGVQGANIAYNVTHHELMHAVGIGHDTTVGSMMSNDQLFALGENQRLVPNGTHREALRNFSRKLDPCNWLPGDPLGNACPHAGQ